MLLQIIHGVGLLHHGFVIYHSSKINIPDTNIQFVEDGKRFYIGYFSLWNFAFQIIYYLFCLLENFTSHKLKACTATSLKRLQDLIFTAVIFPSATLVSTIFWGIYMTDRELMMPRSTDELVPQWISHSMHTVTFVLMTVELVLSRKTLYGGFLPLLIVYFTCITYTVMLLSISLLYGTALYPFFNMLNNNFLVLLVLLLFSNYHIGIYKFGEKYLFIHEKQI